MMKALGEKEIVREIKLGEKARDVAKSKGIVSGANLVSGRYGDKFRLED